MIAKTVQENILRLAAGRMERTMPEVIQKDNRKLWLHTDGYLRAMVDLAYSEKESRLAKEIEIMIADLHNAWPAGEDRP